MHTCSKCGKEAPDDELCFAVPSRPIHKNRCIANMGPKCIFHETCGGFVGGLGARNETCDKCYDEWCKAHIQAWSTSRCKT